ncbi:DNA primase [Sphingomonas histidinilytica]|uniref:LPD7 domain-containing protein n=1 Tax=Rhizorhabdus histidinilytica TaxID=439228 RepID=UPI001ADAD386|nr:LPD7 domain-containing protein [Rhizorhabdus histidinilytica]MBO9378894.1 DNA primase [Rhizorhabdus histidinilytica]
MADKPNSSEPETQSARKRAGLEMPAELESRFLRVGDKLYRSAHDRQAVATISTDRIKARDARALPDLVRLAKANGWTALKINGDAEFKRAAYLAAAAQGLTIEGYRPDAKARAAATRDQARQSGNVRSHTQTRTVEEKASKERSPRTPSQVRVAKEQPSQRADLAERFRRQSHADNARDPQLCRAQSHVAHAMTIAVRRFPDDEARRNRFVDQRKEEVARRIEQGERISGIQVRQQQDEPIRAIQQSQILQRQRSPNGR